MTYAALLMAPWCVEIIFIGFHRSFQYISDACFVYYAVSLVVADQGGNAQLCLVQWNIYFVVILPINCGLLIVRLVPMIHWAQRRRISAKDISLKLSRAYAAPGSLSRMYGKLFMRVKLGATNHYQGQNSRLYAGQNFSHGFGMNRVLSLSVNHIF